MDSIREEFIINEICEAFESVKTELNRVKNLKLSNERRVDLENKLKTTVSSFEDVTDFKVDKGEDYTKFSWKLADKGKYGMKVSWVV